MSCESNSRQRFFFCLCFCFFLFLFVCCLVVFFFSNPVDWVFHKSGSQRHAVLSLFRGCGTRGEKVAGHEQFSKSANSKTHNTHTHGTTNACVRICVMASAAIRRSILVQPSVAIGPCHLEMRRRHQQPTCGAFQVQPHPSPSNEIQNKVESFQSVIPSLFARNIISEMEPMNLCDIGLLRFCLISVLHVGFLLVFLSFFFFFKW
jgi:hypothetical protein